MKKIFGHKWYYYMLPKDDKYTSLFSVIPRSSLLNKFVVCWDRYDEVNQKSNKLYTYFDSYIKFAIYFLKLKQESRCFYEIIFGEKIQKPHFDIDMELVQKSDLREKVLQDLINEIVKLIPKINVERDVCIYSSHGENKISYHVIVNHFYHSNHEQAKAFYYTIMKNLPKEYYDNNWIDHSVYSKTQQFRIYGSQKTGTKRTKIFHDEWLLNGKEIIHETDEDWEDLDMKFLINLDESLIGARVSNATALPDYQVPEEFQKKSYIKGEDIQQDVAMEAFYLLAKALQIPPDSERFPYKFDRVDSSFVLLRRIKASKCKMCKRVHQHENPYLLITEDLNVFFHCRRAPPNKKLYIGSLNKDKESEYKPFEEVKISDKQGEKKTQEKNNLNDIRQRLDNLAKRRTETKEKKPEKKRIDGYVSDRMVNLVINGEYKNILN